MARQINFFDGATSGTTPTIGNLVASNLVQYANDAAYEGAESGAPTTGNIYYNTTSNVIRYYDGSAWVSIVDETEVQTLTNKSIDADQNTITNIDNADIKAAAGINATKIHDGSVDNTEFGYLNGVTSSIQTQIDSKIGVTGLTDNRLVRTDGTNQIQQSGITVDDLDNVTGVNDLTVDGDLTVNGTTTTINTSTLDVKDVNITVNNGGNQASAEDAAGLTVEMSDATDASLIYDSAATSRFRIGDVGSEAEIATISGQQVITNKDIDGGTASNTNRVTLPKNTTTNLDALTDKEATLAYDTTLAKPVYNDGSQWIPVGTGSGGVGKNYIGNPDFENNTSGVSTYDEAEIVYTDGTGGSPTGVTVSRNTTTPLAGSADLKIDKAASSSNGEGVTILSDTIDRADVGRKLFISMEFDGSDANYPDGDFSLQAYDVAGAQILPVVPVSGLNDDGSFPNLKTKILAYVVTDSSTTGTIRVSLHLESDNSPSTAYTLYVDDAKLSPNASVPGAIVTPWMAWTPTGAWSTNTTYAGYWRRVGDTLEAKVEISLSGDPGSSGTVLQVNLPNSLQVDTSVEKHTYDVVGHGTFYDNGSGTGLVHIVTVSGSPGVVRVIYPQADASGAGNVNIQSNNPVDDNNPIAWANGDKVTFNFKVKISGWAASAALSTTEAGLSTVKVRAEGNGGTSLTAATTNIDFSTELEDSHNVWDGTTFTAPRTANYKVSGLVLMTAASTSTISAYIDGTIDRGLSINPNVTAKSINGVVKLQRGEALTFRSSNTETLSNDANFHHISIEEMPDFTIFSTYSEGITAKYTTNDGDTYSNGNIIDFEEQTYDSRGSVTIGASWKFTASVPGKYHVSAGVESSSFTPSAGNFYGIDIYKNGSQDTRLSLFTANAAIAQTIFLSGSTDIQLNAGDYIDLRFVASSGSMTLTAGNPANHISIRKVD